MRTLKDPAMTRSSARARPVASSRRRCLAAAVAVRFRVDDDRALDDRRVIDKAIRHE